MITTQSTTAKRRLSVHNNLFDPALYKLPQAPQGTFQPRKQALPARPAIFARGEEPLCRASYFKQKFVNLFPKDVQGYLPEVDIKITSICLVWYVTSSISSNLSKTILRDFTHPVALTELQFLVSAMLCVGFMSVVNCLQKRNSQHLLVKACQSFPEGIVPSYLNGNFRESIMGKFLVPCKLVLMTTFPMGIFQFVGHISTHKATSLIPVSLVHSIKALSPIITVGYYRLFEGKQYNTMIYYTLVPLIMGVMVTCWATHGSKAPDSTNTLQMTSGLFFASLSMLIFVSQNIFAKGFLTTRRNRGILPSSSESNLNKRELSPVQLDKITILFYCSCMGFLLTLPPFLTSEFLQHQSVFRDLSVKVGLLIAFHGAAHFLQALLAFQLIGMLSSVNYSVANIMKRIVIILVALIWESKLNIVQLIGLSLTLGGLYGYDKWGSKYPKV
ncbi:SLY41 (YOR307C) [Zygosaccharomyces parabailii]|uniref:BN860_13894g1_1 n=1 Tax=Zygosaccharomyces bailii (strain CLIB 213 / ATCC 58445 / CBS 680 / BCRC 21525 / NBRC 1098 / NCYC 1416 / NRRL Y-2227) TaxID=1333698 RepID=A0A8J2T4Z9_ZYGB2|nr:SLY41 (YOR307C) [Zygosaccharomyces parabailii]CDF88593.1 BN860_13894g1_1 [Zygosaccharomyces bailii CLIB 213]CDH10152.1 probable SLY41-Putative transporter of the triose phosphate translocator family-unknown function [Zygosaccharomyces bailii ISA1307]